MNDLNTIQHYNEFAADVERSKTSQNFGDVFEAVWPSDAPAIPRQLNGLKERSPEVYAKKAWSRRRQLIRSAQIREDRARSRVQACAARVLDCDSLANRLALVEALREAEALP